MAFESSKEKQSAEWGERARNMRDPETKRLLPSAIAARREKQKENEKKALQGAPGYDKYVKRIKKEGRPSPEADLISSDKRRRQTDEMGNEYEEIRAGVWKKVYKGENHAKK